MHMRVHVYVTERVSVRVLTRVRVRVRVHVRVHVCVMFLSTCISVFVSAAVLVSVDLFLCACLCGFVFVRDGAAHYVENNGFANFPSTGHVPWRSVLINLVEESNDGGFHRLLVLELGTCAQFSNTLSIPSI